MLVTQGETSLCSLDGSGGTEQVCQEGAPSQRSQGHIQKWYEHESSVSTQLTRLKSQPGKGAKVCE